VSDHAAPISAAATAAPADVVQDEAGGDGWTPVGWTPDQLAAAQRKREAAEARRERERWEIAEVEAVARRMNAVRVDESEEASLALARRLVAEDAAALESAGQARPEETPLWLEDPAFEPLGSDPVFEPLQHGSIGAIGVPRRDLEREAREAYLVEEVLRRRLREQHDARERDLLVRREREEAERRRAPRPAPAARARPDDAAVAPAPAAAARPDPPENLICPISFELLVDPVFAVDGHTYSRAEIQAWLDTGKSTSPKTNEPLAHTFLTPNHLVRGMVQEYLEANG